MSGVPIVDLKGSMISSSLVVIRQRHLNKYTI